MQPVVSNKTVLRALYPMSRDLRVNVIQINSSRVAVHIEKVETREALAYCVGLEVRSAVPEGVSRL
jgi:hypothetical protein